MGQEPFPASRIGKASGQQECRKGGIQRSTAGSVFSFCIAETGQVLAPLAHHPLPADRSCLAAPLCAFFTQPGCLGAGGPCEWCALLSVSLRAQSYYIHVHKRHTVVPRPSGSQCLPLVPAGRHRASPYSGLLPTPHSTGCSAVFCFVLF